MATQDNPVLCLQGVQCRRGKQILLEDVNVTFERGIVTGLVGSNGVGKSTLMSTIIGDLSAESGQITYGDIPIQKISQRSNIFGVVMESHGLPEEIRVSELIRYWADVHKVSKSEVDSLCEALRVNGFWSKKLKKLSTGMRRRVELVLALLPDPEVVILDEPFNGLDIDGIDEVSEIIRSLKNRRKIILLTTHTMSEVDQLVDRLYALHNKRLNELYFDKGVLGASEAAYRYLREGMNK